MWQGKVICASCMRLAKSGRRAALVLLFCFLCDSFTSGLCWMAASMSGPSQTVQSAMCQFYYSYFYLTQSGKTALLLPLTLILLPTKLFLWYPPSLFLFPVIFTFSLPPCISIFDILTCFFSVSSFISVTQPLSLSVSVSCFE